MQDNNLTKSFEQIQTTELPKKVMRIVKSIAKRHHHVGSEQSLTPKQIELAVALLQMKLYQALGPASRDISDAAINELHQLLSVGQIGESRRFITS